MQKILCIVVFLSTFLSAQTYKILGLVPFGDYNLKIVFDQDISTLKFDEKKLQDGRVFVDLESVLVVPKKSFIFKDNSTINVAQNTPKIVRVVIKPTKSYTIAKEAQNLYIRMSESTSQMRATTTTSPAISTAPSSSVAKKKIVIDAGH